MSKTNHIQAELQLISPAVADLSNTTPFAVPEGYFERFPIKILQKISQNADNEEVITSLSPLLQSLQRQNPFEVPDNYFRGFQFKLPAEEQKVVSMFAWKKWAGYAAAACFLGIIMVNVFNFKKSSVADGNLAQQNAAVEEQLLTTESMQTYLNEVDHMTDLAIPGTDATAGSNLLVDMTPQLISEILKEIPENDISSYISQAEGSETKMLN